MATGRESFSSLPIELHRVVLTCLPNSDLKNARLVNKQWSAVTATVLWSHLKIDLAHTGHRSLDSLLDWNPGGVLDNVKKLTVTTGQQKKLDRDLEHRATCNLLLLIGALPRDGLVEFQCRHFGIDRNVLGLLLRTQPRLNNLEFSISETEQDGWPSPNYIRSGLGNMRSLQINVIGKYHHTYQGLVQWFPHTPILSSLCIKGRIGAYARFYGWASLAGTAMVKLRHLVLEDLHLSKQDGIIALLDLPCLKELDIISCIGVSSLLRSMADRYRETGYSALESFIYAGFRVPEDICKASEMFFESVDSLKEISYRAVKGLLPSLKSLKRTGKSLEMLNVDAPDSDVVYSASDLKVLVANCPRLKKLRLSLGDLSHNVDSMSWESSRLTAEYEESLVSPPTLPSTLHS